MKIAYEHLLEFFQGKPSENDISEKLFQLGHENTIESKIFDIEFTPNRGDCLSVYGLARDLNIFYPMDLNLKTMQGPIRPLNLNFVNNAVDDCPRISFLKIKIEGEIKPYRPYLNSFFKEFDIKKNNFFTDISNYVAYEIGQPTHCYDFKKIGKLIEFNNINTEREFHTLLDKKINLSGNNCVFMSDGNLINLAGVMGGMSTSCCNKTDNVLVECAYFRPESIIQKSVKYDLISDASYKFERGVDPDFQLFSLRRFIQIVSEHVKITDLSLFSKDYKSIKKKEITFNEEKINKVLGTSITKEFYTSHLNKLGFNVIDNKIKVPAYRHDIENQNDLSEEIARIIGYDNIKPKEFSISNQKRTIQKNKPQILRDFLIDQGFNEAINLPFSDKFSKKSIEIINPLDSSKKFLRTRLKESLLENVLYNENRQCDSIKIFEIADLYNSKNNQTARKVLSLIVTGIQGYNYKEFSKKLDKKYLIDVFKKIDIDLDDKIIQEIPRSSLKTKQKSKIFFLEMSIGDLPKSVFKYESKTTSSLEFNKKYELVSEFPSSTRDISFLLSNEKLIEELEHMLLSKKSDNLKRVFVFDFYKKNKNHIKIGFRFVFQSLIETLTIEAIDIELNSIINDTLKLDGVEIPGLSIK